MLLEGRKNRLFREVTAEMQQASAALQVEKAAKIRDDIVALQNLELRGDGNSDFHPKSFTPTLKRV
jgi:excinuclease ABC subunit C